MHANDEGITARQRSCQSNARPLRVMGMLGVAATDDKAFHRRWTQIDADDLRQRPCNFTAETEHQSQLRSSLRSDATSYLCPSAFICGKKTFATVTAAPAVPSTSALLTTNPTEQSRNQGQSDSNRRRLRRVLIPPEESS